MNVEGVHCDRCRPGNFGLDAKNPLGCSQCYCFGATTQCSEAKGLIRTWVSEGQPSQAVVCPTGECWPGTEGEEARGSREVLSSPVHTENWGHVTLHGWGECLLFFWGIVYLLSLRRQMPVWKGGAVGRGKELHSGGRGPGPECRPALKPMWKPGLAAHSC